MAESLVQVNSGAGPKLHTWQRTIGANAVEDEVIIHGEPYLATYVIVPAASVSIATAADHVLQIMAGASLNVIVRKLRVFQTQVATTAAINQIDLFRLTTAGTGGTAITPGPYDTGDAAAGAAAMTLPSVKGTEGTRIGTRSFMVVQTVPTGPVGEGTLLAEWDFDALRTKGLRIPAGTANGLAVKIINGTAGASVRCEAIISELSFV